MSDVLDYLVLAYSRATPADVSRCRAAGHICPLLAEALVLMSRDFDPPEDRVHNLHIDLEAVEKALMQTKGNKTRAAALLGCSRQTLIRKLKMKETADAAYCL